MAVLQVVVSHFESHENFYIQLVKNEEEIIQLNTAVFQQFNKVACKSSHKLKVCLTKLNDLLSAWYVSLNPFLISGRPTCGGILETTGCWWEWHILSGRTAQLWGHHWYVPHTFYRLWQLWHDNLPWSLLYTRRRRQIGVYVYCCAGDLQLTDVVFRLH